MLNPPWSCCNKPSNQFQLLLILTLAAANTHKSLTNGLIRALTLWIILQELHCLYTLLWIMMIFHLHCIATLNTPEGGGGDGYVSCVSYVSGERYCIFCEEAKNSLTGSLQIDSDVRILA